MSKRYSILQRSAFLLLLLAGSISLPGATHTVRISNFAFSPADLTVNPGDIVNWVNDDAAPHTSTSEQGRWDSGTLNQGQNYSATFSVAGLLPYYCQIHPSMRGVIRVVESSLPNLVPYLVQGWAEPIVVADTLGRLQDTRPIYDNQDLYLSWVVANTGDADITTEFMTRLLLNGQILTNWSRTSLPAHIWNSREGLFLGRLPAGTHRFRMEIDATGAITESSENDNIFEKTITVLPANGAGNGRTHQVVIRGFAFIPQELTINPGETVQWTNEDAAPHTSTADQGLWNSGTLNQGQSYSFTFTAPGRYSYFCGFHPNMQGAVVVAGGGGGVRPNLHPFLVEGWSAPITVSTAADVFTEANPILDNQDLFLSWVIANTGGANITNDFITRIFLDGQELTSWSREGLENDIWNSRENYPLGKLAAGVHTLRMVIDATGVVDETDENDNTFEKTITVQATGGTATNQIHTVAIRNFAFVPPSLTIQAGDTVRWTNEDAAPHTSTSDTAIWDSEILNQGQSFSFTFTNAGSYPYFCEVHPSMRGVIEVQAGTAGRELSLRLHRDSAGQLVFNVEGTPGSPVTLESSSDLRTWNIIRTDILFDGSWTYNHPEGATNQHQFFRAYQTRQSGGGIRR